MTDPEPAEWDAYPGLTVQALVVTTGVFKGRICENDDDAFMLRSDMDEFELDWMEEAGVEWRLPEVSEDEIPLDDPFRHELGVDCEIVTFGRFLQCRGNYLIPRQFLRPATVKDLIERYQAVREALFGYAWTTRSEDYDPDDVIDLLQEQSFIADEMWERELKMHVSGGEKTIFLCHASADKPFVRRVCNDLTNAGHRVWMDEFEIAVGDSIVDKINAATGKADALVLFISAASASSAWVKREWQSALSRQLSGQTIRICPAVIEDCEHPSLLADIRYADFRESYQQGLDALTAAFPKPAAE